MKIMLNCLRSKIMILNGKIGKTYAHGEVFFLISPDDFSRVVSSLLGNFQYTEY